MPAKKEITLHASIVETLESMKALTSPSSFNTLADSAAPKNAAGAEHTRSLARVVETRKAEFDSAAKAFFDLADTLRADSHQAGKDVSLARKRARMAVLSRGEKSVVRDIRSFGSDIARPKYDALASKAMVKLSFDELCEAAISF